MRPRLRRVAFDGDGNLIEPTPNAPIGLRVQALADGEMRALWHYATFAQAAPPEVFNVFVTTDEAPFDFDDADHQVDASSTRQYSVDLGPFVHDTLVRVVVRAVASGGASEINTTEAEAVADDQAPALPDELAVEVIDV